MAQNVQLFTHIYLFTDISKTKNYEVVLGLALIMIIHI